MSGLDNLRTRLNFLGGNTQQSRMNKDKLKSLRKALWYSYQAATAQMADGRQFRCLINPDKIKNSYDNKYISIPFEDIVLNEEDRSIITEPERAEQKRYSDAEIGIKPGDVFTWVENGTDWLVYLRRFEETAYFRAEIRRCKYTVDVNGTEYKCYVARNSVNEIDWRHQQEILWNDIDYSLTMYITKDEKTEEFFHRFTKVKINGRPWEVQAIDDMSSDGIIIIALKEWYNNSLAETASEISSSEPEESQNDLPHIVGKQKVYPYEKLTYTIENIGQGSWKIDSNKVKILNSTEDTLQLEVVTGRSSEFNIEYITENNSVILPVEIMSL